MDEGDVMTAKEFLFTLQGYFGTSYNPHQGAVVREWVQAYRGDFAALLDHVTRTREFLPKVAGLTECAKELGGSDYDQNALPPPPRTRVLPLTLREQDELEKTLRSLIPAGYTPPKNKWGQPSPAMRNPDAKPLSGRVLGGAK